MGDATKRYLIRLVTEYRNLMARYGAFRFGVTEEEARGTTPDRVWSLVEYDDGDLGKTVLVHGLFDPESVYDYAISERPVEDGQEVSPVIEVIWLICDACGAGEISDPDECRNCSGAGTLMVDVEEIADNYTGELTEEYVWSQRKAQ